MKEYKGWEIVKMLDEKILKTGDEIEDNDGYSYKVRETCFSGSNYITRLRSDKELGNSTLANSNRLFHKVQKPVSFMEAFNSGKRLSITKEYLEIIEDNYVKYNLECGKYVKLDEIIWGISNNNKEEYVRKILASNCWLIEED